jgi:hypothetical protein
MRDNPANGLQVPDCSYVTALLSSPTESAFLVPRMSAWRRNSIKRPLTRVRDEEIIYRFQLSRILPAGTEIEPIIELNRKLGVGRRHRRCYSGTCQATK